jgi:signal transduction histidine kinase/ligand-binding sensor domain-containing protein/CheY-like chemotaxis protein
MQWAFGKKEVGRLLGVVLVLGSCFCFALDPAKAISQYEHTTWRSEDGLPQNSIQAITQTHDGYLWMGTQEGLVRFNGTTFTVFNKNNTEAIRHNDIRALYEDQAGTLWIGTYGGGLTSYRDNQFHSYTTANGLSNNFVTTILQDKQGRLWIGTQTGLNEWQAGKLVPVDKGEGVSESFIEALATDPEGRLWIGTQKGLNLLEDGKAINSQISKLFSKLSDIRSLYFDRQGVMWIGTNKSLVRFSDTELKEYGASQGLPKGSVTTIRQDREGTLWAGTGGGGVCRLLHENFDCFGTRQGLGGVSVTSIYEDVEGSLWVGVHMGGLNRLKDGNRVAYGSLTLNTPVWAVSEGKDGSIWIGTESGLKRSKDGKLTTYNAPKGASNFITALLEDREGNLWAGTNTGSLTKYSKSGGILAFNASNLSNNYVYSLIQDHTGAIWAGLQRSGLVKVANGKFTTYTKKDGLPSGTVNTVFEDHAHNLWLGTNEGLTLFQNGKFVTYALNESGEGGLGTVVAMYEDSDHVFWIGTYGRGLKRFKDGKFLTIGTKDGLPDDSVWGILEDNTGNFWLSSNQGIARVKRKALNDYLDGKPLKLSFTAYGVSDGMPSVECNGGSQPAAWKTKEGKLLFTNARGLVVIHPDNAQFNRFAPPVKIEKAMINDVKSAYDGLSTAAGRGGLEFQFAALSYLAPDKIAFKYQLEGFEKDWTNAGNRRVAYYTNIPPGRYRFRVIAANNDGVWNEEGASLSFYLKPRFYQTPWFYVVCGLILVFMGVGIYLLRVRQMRKREEELLVLVTERTKELTQEVAEHQKTEKELHIAKETAEAATRARSEFLANMSHEIRTPLNGVMGMLDLAVHTDLTVQQKELLGMAEDSANTLLVVINDILDFSKIEAGRLEFDNHEFDFGTAISESVRTMALRAHQKRLELAYLIAPDVPSHLVGDPIRLRQVLTNVIGNAIKFTPQGEVVLRVELDQHDGDEVELKFSVQDTGIGIPAEKQELIFEAFQQADASVTRKFGGTGLGLAICARIVHLMGGHIWVESQEGSGSTFSFTARFKVGEGTNATTINAELLRNLPVLIVDDNQTNRHILRQIVLAQGMQPVTVDSASAALQAMEEGVKRATPFRLLLTDYRMPGMNGLELVHEVKSRPEFSTTTTIMLTSDDYHGTALKCAELGVEAYLIKPVNPSELLSTIRRLLVQVKSVAAPVEKPRDRSSAPESSKLKILLAEDNLVNQRFATLLLQKMGHEIVVVGSGRQALEQVQRNLFDLVLMDVQMPEMDGFAATKAIRLWETGEGSHVPIIAMTANAMKGDREMCLASGMDGYIAKPVNKSELQRTIHQVLSSASVLAQ